MVRSEFSPAVRQQAKHRAKYRCERCGAKADLELHHIGARMDRSAFNCQVLCRRRWLKTEDAVSTPDQRAADRKLGGNMQRKRVPVAIWVTLWAIIVIAALAVIISVVAWFVIP